MTRKRDKRVNTPSLFGDFEAAQKEASINDLVDEQEALAKEMLLQMLSDSPSDLSPFLSEENGATTLRGRSRGTPVGHHPKVHRTFEGLGK